MNAAPAGRVVVGVDDTFAALQAVREAVDAARRLDAPLHAVRVISLPSPYGWEPLPDLAELDHVGQQFIREVFDRAVGGRPRDVEFRAVIRHGATGPTLTAYARVGDLLVLGRRCGTLQDLFGDRTVRHCARHARCPVLLVPPPEMATAGSVRRQAHRLRKELRRLGGAGIDPATSGTPG